LINNKGGRSDQLATSAYGTSRHFAALRNLVTIGA
jgi:hypothetical protein